MCWLHPWNFTIFFYYLVVCPFKAFNCFCFCKAASPYTLMLCLTFSLSISSPFSFGILSHNAMKRDPIKFGPSFTLAGVLLTLVEKLVILVGLVLTMPSAVFCYLGSAKFFYHSIQLAIQEFASTQSPPQWYHSSNENLGSIL